MGLRERFFKQRPASTPVSSPKKSNGKPVKDAHRVMGFKTQYVIAAMIVFVGISAFCAAILWSHIDRTNSTNPGLWKIGAATPDVLALICVIWHTYAKDLRVKTWCFITDAVIMIAMLVHVAGVQGYETSIAEQTSNLRLAAEMQGQIERQRIEAATQAAQSIQGTSRRASRLRSGALSLGRPNQESADKLAAAAQGIKGETFFPDWYINGPMYAIINLLAVICFLRVSWVAMHSDDFQDENQNGVDDRDEKRIESGEIDPVALHAYLDKYLRERGKVNGRASLDDFEDSHPN